MAFIPTPNGVSLCFHFTTAGQNWEFCLQVRKSAGAPTPTDLATLSSAGATFWTGSLKALIDGDVTLEEVVATDQTSQGAPQDIETVGTTGTFGGTGIPLSNCLVVSQRTAKRGRSYRGRAYVSGLNTSYILNMVSSDATAASNLAAAFTAFAATLDAAGFDVVVVTKQHNGEAVDPAETNEVISFLVDQDFDSQRRRLAGRGN